MREAAWYAWASVSAGGLSLALPGILLLAAEAANSYNFLLLLWLPLVAAVAGLGCWAAWAAGPSALDRRPSKRVVAVGALLSAAGLVAGWLVLGMATPST